MLTHQQRPPTKVYFIRHSEPDYSVENDYLRPLTPRGLEDAEELKNILSEVKFDCLYSSPYKHAIQTILPIARAQGIGIEIIDEFRERKIADEWISDYHAFVKKQWQDFDYSLPGGESLNEAQKRSTETLNSMCDKIKGRTVGVGIHRTVLALIIRWFAGFTYEEFVYLQDKMPYVLLMEFEGCDYLRHREIETGLGVPNVNNWD